MIGDYRHLATVEDPTAPLGDGDGGYTLTWTPLDPPTWWISVLPATVQDQERITVGVMTDKATSIIAGRYHPGVSTATRITNDNGVVYAIAGVRHQPERDQTETIAVEVA